MPMPPTSRTAPCARPTSARRSTTAWASTPTRPSPTRPAAQCRSRTAVRQFGRFWRECPSLLPLIDDRETAVRTGKNGDQTPGRDAGGSAALAGRDTVFVEHLPRDRPAAVPAHSFSPHQKRLTAVV